MKVIIIGGRGFVGRAITAYCKEESGIRYTVVHRRNYRRYKNSSCDVLINANGNSKKFLAEQDPKKDFQLSVQSVSDTIKDFRFKRYVYLSSVAVYPDPGLPGKTKEMTAIDVTRQSYYGFHKYLAEQTVRHHCPDWLILRLGGLIGPGMTKGPVFDVLRGRPLFTHPDSRFQFLDTRFVAAAIFQLLQRGWSRNRVHNLSGRGTVSVSQIMQWAGRKPVKNIPPELKKEIWNVNVDKVSSMLKVPMTKDAVRSVIQEFPKG